MVAEFCNAPTVPEMAIQFGTVVATTAAASVALMLVAWVAERVASRHSRRRLPFFPTLCECTGPPLRRLLPLWWALNSLMTLSAFGQVAATRLWPEFDRLMWGHGPVVLRLLRFTSQLFQDLGQNVVIVGAAWVALNYKDRVVAWLQGAIEERYPSPSLLRLLGPAATLTGWAIVAAAIFASLQNFGVNVKPFLTSVGASSVILGLAAQSTLRNLTGAIMLYTAQPFSPGDRVQFLTTGGGKVIEGRRSMGFVCVGVCVGWTGLWVKQCA